MEARTLFSVARDAAPFEPVDPPYRVYQSVARGAIGYAGDADFYRLGRLRRGDVLSLATCGADSGRGTLGDGQVELFRSGSDPLSPVSVAFDDDHGTGHDAFLYRFVVMSDDTYFVACRAASAVRTGTYEMSAWLEQGPNTPQRPVTPDAAAATVPVESEPDDDATGAVDLSDAWRAVTRTSSSSGMLSAAAEAAADEYALDLRAGDLLSVAARSTSGADLAVRLVDPSGNTAALDLDSRGVIDTPANADVIANAVTTGGTYTVRVWAKGLTSGSYRLDLSLSRPPDPPPAAVVARHVFYNHSAFDHYSPGGAADDDSAVATDKIALLPGLASGLQNVTSYARGINGVMIDVNGLRSDLGPDDFAFDVSVPDSAAAWAAAHAPSAISRRAGAGVGGSDRVSVIWPDGSIVDRWLRVTLRASPANGLAADDVFLFGNVAGESGDDSSAAVVGMADVLRTRARQTAGAGLAEWCDFNRDGRVNALDVTIARGRIGRGLDIAAGHLDGVGPAQPASAGPRVPTLRRTWYEIEPSAR
jgi:hypothetical protein